MGNSAWQCLSPVSTWSLAHGTPAWLDVNTSYVTTEHQTCGVSELGHLHLHPRNSLTAADTLGQVSWPVEASVFPIRFACILFWSHRPMVML